jgi:hypothetical protein
MVDNNHARDSTQPHGQPANENLMVDLGKMMITG